MNQLQLDFLDMIVGSWTESESFLLEKIRYEFKPSLGAKKIQTDSTDSLKRTDSKESFFQESELFWL